MQRCDLEFISFVFLGQVLRFDDEVVVHVNLGTECWVLSAEWVMSDALSTQHSALLFHPCFACTALRSPSFKVGGGLNTISSPPINPSATSMPFDVVFPILMFRSAAFP